MANMINYLSLTGLSKYDLKIKEFIATRVAEGDAPSFKYVDLKDGVLKFYNVNPITEYTEPIFEIELPEQDLSHLMVLVESAVSGNVAVFGQNGQVVDTGIKAEDLAVKTEVQAVQDSVDALADLVGELPEGTSATSVVDYVNIKTAGIATDAALEELNNQVAGLQTAVQGIQEDYLTSEDKTELQGGISTNADAIATIKEDVDAFFKDADMTESAKDTLKELQEYIASDETGAAAMAASIKQNTDNIASLQEEIATKAAQADLEAEVSAREALDARVAAVEGKAHEHANEEVLAGITAEKVSAWDVAETNAKTHADSQIAAEVEARNTAIATAKSEAIADAAAKDAEVLSGANAYTDEKFGAIDLSGIESNANDIADIKEDIAELQAVEYIEITDEQINNLFVEE